MDVRFDGMQVKPPIGVRIEAEAEQRHSFCFEPWKSDTDDVEIDEDIFEEVS